MTALGPLRHPSDARRFVGAHPPTLRRRRVALTHAELWVIELDAGGQVLCVRLGEEAVHQLPERSLVVFVVSAGTPRLDPSLEALVRSRAGCLVDVLWCAPRGTHSARRARPELPWHPAPEWSPSDSLESRSPWATIARFDHPSRAAEEVR